MDLSFEEMAAMVEQPFPFVNSIGLKVLVLERGHVKMLLPKEGNGNHIGTIYAGALFTLAEMPGGALYMSTFDMKKFYPVIKESNVRFRRPATTDVTIDIVITEERIAEIEAEALKNGKADYILESDIVSESGEVVAIARNTYQLRRHGI